MGNNDKVDLTITTRTVCSYALDGCEVEACVTDADGHVVQATGYTTRIAVRRALRRYNRKQRHAERYGW